MSLTDFIAGTSLDEALKAVRDLNRRGLSGSLSYLPRVTVKSEEVGREVEEYEKALEAIQSASLDCDITIKLQQLGIYANRSTTEDAVQSIVQSADAKGVLVWMDMERPDTVDDTLEIWARVLEDHSNVGICLQAYLTRTAADLDWVLSRRGTVRLVKGFYKAHDIHRWRDVTQNYERLMESILRESPRPAIATHDERLVEKARKLIVANDIESAEFQFFKGVCDDLAAELQRSGFRVRIYVPYGKVLRYWIDGITTFDMRRQLQRVAGLPPRP